MVRLTQALCKYVPEWYHLRRTGGAFFRKQSLFYMTRFYKNIGWSTHKNAMNRFHYLLKGEMFYAKRNVQLRKDINRSRVAAACDEHGYKYQYLVSTLPKLDINLNMASLARLAIYEPQTFRSLIDICREATEEELQPANFDAKQIS